MTHKFKAIFVAGLAAALLAMPTALAQPKTPDDARIARAIKDYAERTAQEASAARDARVASRIGALADNPGSPVLGNPKGDVTIVAFFDYACPYCKAVHPRLLALVNSDRRIKLVLKEFPILTPESMIASRMALAAAKQGKYRPFHLALMHALGQLREADIVETARVSGLDIARLRKDMYAPDVTDEIIANFNLARATRTFQTPTFIIGSHVLTSDSADINFAAEVAKVRAGRR
jgi:protein-disulfide isomerase